jgi:nitroreductase
MTPFEELLQARYGDARPTLPDIVNETASALLGHRSVRAFLPAELDDGVLELLVAAAQSASTSSHLQAWSVVAVRDPARKARLAALAGNQKHVRETPLFLVWLADLSRLRRIAGRLGEPAEGLDYVELFLISAIDATLAAQNAVVAAESLGLGTVYIGGIRNKPEEVAAELDLPPNVFPLYGMCIGRPDPSRPTAVRPRLPQKLVLHRERYGADGEEEALAGYDRLMESFYRSQQQPVQPWTRHASARVKSPASLSGRDRLKEALTNLGFKLS